MVIVSKRMRDTYAKYGDLLAFDITYGLLRNVTHDNKRYRVGVFTVHDTNLRLMLAGIAIMVDETTQAMFFLFDSFIRLQGKPPSSIITDDQPTMASAINELRAN